MLLKTKIARHGSVTLSITEFTIRQHITGSYE